MNREIGDLSGTIHIRIALFTVAKLDQMIYEEQFGDDGGCAAVATPSLSEISDQRNS